MATVTTRFYPEEAQFLTTAFPAFGRIAGTNYPVTSLAFDAATQENAYWKFDASYYASGNLTLNLAWYADTATSGNIVWGAAIAAITPDTDTQDVETKAFATALEVTDSHLGTTGQRLHRATITISNLDSLAIDDVVWLKIYRKAADAADTMTGDGMLVMATMSYTSVP